MPDFRFKAIQPPCEWHGRYRRPPGDESAYHVKVNGEIYIFWRDSGYNLTCSVKETTPDVRKLAEAVNTAKQAATGTPGGSFVINEFGQVICPIGNGRDRFLVGEARGDLYFEDPRYDSRLCLNKVGLMCGDPWPLPYIGLQYQLSKNNNIWFKYDDDDGTQPQYPPEQDFDLIAKIRTIRPTGPVRFLVNHYGIVLTKKEVQPKQWRAVYVGRIYYRCWFNMEMVEEEDD